MDLKVLLPFLLLGFSIVPNTCNGALVTVSAPVGDIQGVTKTTLFAGQSYNITCFYGIPYAESTGGERRFTKPVKKATFMVTYNATQQKDPCPQNEKWTPGSTIESTEDCLNLNIILPESRSGNGSKAVMVFIHGGGFQFGFQNGYISEALPALHDVIFVTMNYRLSAYGFLASSKHGLKGNYGLWDQHMAIQWVHDNIASFGGDPGRVTLFGESAGSVSAIYQALYEGNTGLFQRIIAESGAVETGFGFNKNPDRMFNGLAMRTKCDRQIDVVGCLNSLSVAELGEHFLYNESILPVQDGEFINYNIEELYNNISSEAAKALRLFGDLDVIIGLNSDEGYSDLLILLYKLGMSVDELSDGVNAEFFKTVLRLVMNTEEISPKEAVIESIMHQYTNWSDPFNDAERRSQLLKFLKDFYYTTSSVRAIEAHAIGSFSKKTYMYHFEHKPSYSAVPAWVTGADHHEEMLFVLGFPLLLSYISGIYSPDPISTLPQNEQELSKSMMKYWAQFAKIGNPNDGTAATWPEYTSRNQSYIRFLGDGNSFQTGRRFRPEYVNYWANVFPEIVEITKRIETDNSTACITGSGSVLQFSQIILLTCAAMSFL